MQNKLFLENRNNSRHIGFMNAVQLKASLETLQLRQHEAAELLGVTSRAIGMWANGEREVASPAAAYLSLLLSLPAALRAKELARLKQKEDPSMYEGMYRVDIGGAAGGSVAVLVFQGGQVFGADVGGVSYDGAYEPTGTPGEVSLKLTLSVPPGVPLIQGVTAGHDGFTFDVGPQRVGLLSSSTFPVPTPIGTPMSTVSARITKIRGLPEARALQGIPTLAAPKQRREYDPHAERDGRVYDPHGRMDD